MSKEILDEIHEANKLAERVNGITLLVHDADVTKTFTMNEFYDVYDNTEPPKSGSALPKFVVGNLSTLKEAETRAKDYLRDFPNSQMVILRRKTEAKVVRTMESV